MYFRQLAVLTQFVAATAAMAQADIPARMEGQYRNPTYGNVGGSKVELIKLETPERASIRVTMTEVYYHGTPCEVKPILTVADRWNRGWRFSVRIPECLTYTISVEPVDGKRRFEGTYSTEFPSEGIIFYEW